MNAQARWTLRDLVRAVANWGPAVAWAMLIFAWSSQPNLTFAEDANVDFVIRKLGHMAVFGVLSLLIWRGLSQVTSLRYQWAWTLALAVLYAFTDERHQAGVAGRHASLLDVGIDAVGALIAVAAVGRGRIRRREATSRSRH